MCAPTLSRRGLLQAGTGLVAAVAFGILPARATRSASASTPHGAGGPPGASRFVPVAPRRVVDTRSSGPWRRVDRNRLRVEIAGHAGVPSSASAVAVTVSAIAGRRRSRAGDGAGVSAEPTTPATPSADEVTGNTAGFVAVVPASPSTDHPRTMLLDIGATGSHSRTCFVGLGDGALDVFHDTASSPVTVDVVGYFEPSGPTSAGRTIVVPATRLIDTAASADPFAAWEMRQVSTAGACPDDAVAVLVDLTAASVDEGHWTAFPSGTPPPTWSLTTVAGAASAFAVVALDHGTFRLRSDTGGHVAVDVVGYVTGASAATTSDGLFVPETPYRALDTRLVDQPVPAGSSREVAVAPPSCSALAMGITVAETSAAGGVATWGAGDQIPRQTSVTFRAGSPVSAFAVPRVGRRGVACGPVGGSAHVVVDVYGWFTGTRADGDHPVLGSQPYGIQGIDMEAHAAEWFDYGLSTEGRPLRAFRHGSGPRHALITTGLHGDEHTGTSVLADVITRAPVPGWTLWLVPIANPDARAANRRYVHDVDMNRDFPTDWNRLPAPTPSGCVTTRTGSAPISLIETRQLSEAMTDGPFRRAEVSISHHDNYNWVAPQSGSPSVLRSLADDYARATGLRRPGENGAIVPTSPSTTRVPGGFETFAHGLGMSSFLVENKAGYIGDRMCAGAFGLQPAAADVAPHHDALRALLTDARLP